MPLYRMCSDGCDAKEAEPAKIESEKSSRYFLYIVSAIFEIKESQWI
jgi:hypothetical protein